ncbi:LysR substrate-binding domain-containing protein [Alteromonas sp. CYL-A6]|uniref:LysR substrate-binding domain-containing protein n=1 Tax=Alteromonas nitratireducens TaxID=3390813 RepID=UPI0034BC00DB
METQPDETKVDEWPSIMLDIDLLKTFNAIAETGSMAKAARMVFRTPAAVSMQIKKLEELLKCQLLSRKSKETKLTNEGETLIRYCRQILRLNDEAVRHFIKPKLTGKVTVGLPEQFGSYELPLILSHFAKTHPSVQVDVVMDQSSILLKKFEDEIIDIAMLSVNIDTKSEASMKPVRLEKIVWAALDGGEAINKEPLPLALAEKGCNWRDLALKALDTQGRKYRLAYSSENCNGQLAAVRADLAIAAVPDTLVKPPLKKVPESFGLPTIGYAQTSLLVREEASDEVKALSDFMMNILTTQRH